MKQLNPEQAQAIDQLVGLFSDGLMASAVARHLTCTEVEVLADVFRAFDQPEAARVWISSHAEADDDEDDLHFTERDQS